MAQISGGFQSSGGRVRYAQFPSSIAQLSASLPNVQVADLSKEVSRRISFSRVEV
jgi:hypothetical protein